jgi:taurine dioxygenase
MRVVRTGAALGAEIHDVDFSAELAAETVDGIHRALLDHQVVVLRAPELTVDQHVALAERFGEPEVHAFFPNLGGGYERVSVLDSEDGTRASMWHADETFLERPPLGTLLHAQVIPEFGGDTVWASCTAAYEALSAPMKTYLEGLTALHDLARTVELAYVRGHATAERYAASVAADRTTAHPVVCTHPETGARSLYVNHTYTRSILGLPPAEADAVLAFLYRHMTTERFTYRHRWSPGDLVIWDNRCTLHNALPDFSGHRRMHRVSVLGARPK